MHLSDSSYGAMFGLFSLHLQIKEAMAASHIKSLDITVGLLRILQELKDVRMIDHP